MEKLRDDYFVWEVWMSNHTKKLMYYDLVFSIQTSMTYFLDVSYEV